MLGGRQGRRRERRSEVEGREKVSYIMFWQIGQLRMVQFIGILLIRNFFRATLNIFLDTNDLTF